MYHIKERVIKNGPHERKVLVIEFDDSNMSIVGEFLMSDASLLNFNVLDLIDYVLLGKSEYEESNGNRCSLEITKHKTRIEDLFLNMYDDFESLPTYEIHTKILRDLIVMWQQKLNEFQQ